MCNEGHILFTQLILPHTNKFSRISWQCKQGECRGHCGASSVRQLTGMASTGLRQHTASARARANAHTHTSPHSHNNCEKCVAQKGGTMFCFLCFRCVGSKNKQMPMTGNWLKLKQCTSNALQMRCVCNSTTLLLAHQLAAG